MRPAASLWLLARLACGAAMVPQAALAESVKISAAPFVWAPSMRGTLEEGPVVIPLDASAGDLAGGIKAGGMVHVEADARRWHASVQAIYADFHDTSFAPVFGADVKSSLFTVEALAGPRLSLGKATVVPMAGLRHTGIKGAFDAAGLGRLSASRTWNEGLAGLEVGVPVSSRLALRARGTVAVLGPRGQSSADGIAVCTLRLSRSLSLAVGYRWAQEKVLAARPGDFGLDLKAQGPVLGLVFGL